jgi:hypothetical protein
MSRVVTVFQTQVPTVPTIPMFMSLRGRVRGSSDKPRCEGETLNDMRDGLDDVTVNQLKPGPSGVRTNAIEIDEQPACPL